MWVFWALCCFMVGYLVLGLRRMIFYCEFLLRLWFRFLEFWWMGSCRWYRIFFIGNSELRDQKEQVHISENWGNSTHTLKDSIRLYYFYLTSAVVFTIGTSNLGIVIDYIILWVCSHSGWLISFRRRVLNFILVIAGRIVVNERGIYIAW